MFDMGEDDEDDDGGCPDCGGWGLRSEFRKDINVIATVICECPAGAPFRRDRNAAAKDGGTF